MKTVEERLRSYEPLWENWTYTGNFLGEGAMSSVFEIESTAMGLREVAALKIITVSRDFRGEVKIPENALNEIKILRTLSGCANIVHYHDSTQRKIYDDNGNLTEIDILIKMEKLKPLSEGDKLSESQVIHLAKDMCNALTHAAEHGIIHRDIKPQNIFVDNDGTYKLGDFGISKIISDMSHSYTMNIGTLAYTAPEVQYNTTGVYDIAADIYSLGIVLYSFLNNGCMPFVNSCSSLHEAITKRLSGAPFPSPANGSKNLKSIIMRACSKDLSKRYRTPKEMLDDLELLSTGGKKMVIDPFATLDANIDIAEPEYEAYGSTATAETDTASGGLKMRMSTPSFSEKKPEKPPAPASTGGGLKISMRSAAPKTPEPASVPTPAEVKSAPDTGSGLKISMKSKAPEKAACESSAPMADKTPAPPSGTASALKTTMKSRPTAVTTAVTTAAPAADTKKEEPEEKKPSSFFTNPSL